MTYRKFFVLIGISFIYIHCGKQTAPSRVTSDAPSRISVNKNAEQGYASWYGPGFQGKTTASGERYNMHHLTAAHRTLPFGTMVRVENLETGQSIDVRINDRGPFVKGRIIDLSKKAAQKIGLLDAGVARVQVYPLGSTRQSQSKKTPARSRETAQNTKFYVQMGSFSEDTNAKSWKSQLKSTFSQAELNVIRQEGLHRVLAGPFSAENEALQFQQQAARQGFESFVLQF